MKPTFDQVHSFNSVSHRDTHENGVHGSESPPMTDSLRNARRFALPGDCRRIVIVGAGGFGREVLQWAREAWPDQASLISEFRFDDPRRLDGFSTGVEILSAVTDY